jgi:hypothetical protein
MTKQKKDEGVIPMSSRLIRQLSQGTIQGPIDAIVELVTNSEDSYTRLKPYGDIEILFRVLKKPEKRRKAVLGVRDEAEGMTYNKLLESLEFGPRVSGQKAGSKIRGFLGRGMKEAILGLGRGYIITRKGEEISIADVFFDESNEPRYRIWQNPPLKPIRSMLRKHTSFTIPKTNGTIVFVSIEREVGIPQRENLRSQILNHYALRKILMRQGRKVRLFYRDQKNEQQTWTIKYEIPATKVVLDKDLDIGYGEENAHLTVYESEEILDKERPGNLQFSKSGILITTEDVVLDNRLFAYQNESAAYYFHGELSVPCFARQFEKDDFSSLSMQRNGLDPRHEIFKALEKTCNRELAPLIEKKRIELAGPSAPRIPDARQKQLENICKILNDLTADFEFETPNMGQGGAARNGGPPSVTIIPSYVVVYPEQVRALSVYAPRSSDHDTGDSAFISLEGSGVSLVDSSIYLSPVKDSEKTLYGFFRVRGELLGHKVTAKASFRGMVALSTIEVKREERRGRKKRTRSERAGPIKSIDFDTDPNPLLPVEYHKESGVIRIYVRFPFVKLYIGDGGSGLERPESRAMFAELVGEAFCRHIARTCIELGKYQVLRGDEINAFEKAFNDQRLVVMRRIHEEVERILALALS